MILVAGFWCEVYHRGQLHCVSWESGPPVERDTSIGGGMLDF